MLWVHERGRQEQEERAYRDARGIGGRGKERGKPKAGEKRGRESIELRGRGRGNGECGRGRGTEGWGGSTIETLL